MPFVVGLLWNRKFTIGVEVPIVQGDEVLNMLVFTSTFVYSESKNTVFVATIVSPVLEVVEQLIIPVNEKITEKMQRVRKNINVFMSDRNRKS